MTTIESKDLFGCFLRGFQFICKDCIYESIIKGMIILFCGKMNLMAYCREVGWVGRSGIILVW